MNLVIAKGYPLSGYWIRTGILASRPKRRSLDSRPYRVFFASGDWTCSIARFRGTMKGPMMMGAKEIQPTGKPFEVDFSTVATWHEGQIVEENLMYDLVGFLQQIGLSK